MIPGNFRYAVAAAVCMALAASRASAEDSALRAQVESLRAAITEQRAQLEAQARLLEAQQAHLDELTHKLEETATVAQELPRLSMHDGRPSVTAADGRASISFRSLVQADGALYHEDPAGPLSTDYRRGSVGGQPNPETAAARDFGNGFVFRRARLGVEGRFARDFSYRLSLELGGAGGEGPTRIDNAWIMYGGLAPLLFQIGAFSPAANLDGSTSPDDLVFIERASSATLSRALAGGGGRIGLAVRARGERWSGSVALTTRTVNDPSTFDSQLGVVARVGVHVADGADFDVHLGASGSYVFSPAGQGDAAAERHPIRLRDRPEIAVDGTRLIDTGAIDAAHASVIGLEFGATWKSLYLQGEDFRFNVERRAPSTLANPEFGGYYLQGSWLLTGERRIYNAATGTFQNPRPRSPVGSAGGFGAWEIAARYSRMDLDFMAGSEGNEALPGGVRGGNQSIWTLGVNWYLNPNLRLMLDYLFIGVDRLNPAGPGDPQPFGPAPYTPPTGVDIGQDLDVLALRTQYSF